MGAEFNWWLLIVGVVAGGGLTWLVLADFTRRDTEIADDETAAEATWIARTLDNPALDADAVEDVLRAHRRYLGFPPPDALVDAGDLSDREAAAAGTESTGSGREPAGSGREAADPDPLPPGDGAARRAV